MASRHPRAGVTSVTIDSVAYDLVSDLQYSLNTIKRETLIGMDAVHGTKDAVVAGKVSFKVRDASGLSVAGFQDMTSVNVVAHLANGKSIVGTGMWTTDVQEVDAGDAVIGLTFEGASVTEIGGQG